MAKKKVETTPSGAILLANRRVKAKCQLCEKPFAMGEVVQWMASSLNPQDKPDHPLARTARCLTCPDYEPAPGPKRTYTVPEALQAIASSNHPQRKWLTTWAQA